MQLPLSPTGVLVARHLIEVFLSSTARDLEDHRKAIHAELSSTRVFHCVWQEDFGPQDAGAVEFCQKQVRQCEIFLGLVGLRRGWEPMGDNEHRSITEMEHDWAKEGGCRRFIYVAPDNLKVAGDLRESDDLHARQEKFRQRVMAGGERIISQKGFENPERFAANVVKHLLCQHIAENLIEAAPPQTAPSRHEADDQEPAVAAAVEKLAEDRDVDLLALAKNPQGVDVKDLEAKLEARAKSYEVEGQRQNKISAEYWRHIGALAFLHNTLRALAAYQKAVVLDPAEPEAWRNLGELQYRLGDLPAAERSFSALVTRGEEINDAHVRSLGLVRLGWIYSSYGDLARAEEITAEAAHLAEIVGSTEDTARAYSYLGNIYRIRGDLGKAEEMHYVALALNEALGSKEGMATAYGSLGMIHSTRGDLSKADEMHRKALALDEELDSKEGMAVHYTNLGNVHRTRGDLGNAEEMHRKALALNEELDNKEGVAIAYGNLGNVHRARADLDKADAMHRRALALHKELGSKEGMAIAYANLGNIHRVRGDLSKAEAIHRKALALNKKLGSKEGMAVDYTNLGEVHETRGDLRKAEQMHRKALALNEELGRKEGLATNNWNLASIHERKGEKKLMCTCLRRARDLWKQMGLDNDAADAEAWLKRAGCDA